MTNRETVIFEEIELEVEFDYQPEEPEERYDSNMTGYPGCPEEISITKIEFDGRDLTWLLMFYEDEILEALEEQRPQEGDNY